MSPEAVVAEVDKLVRVAFVVMVTAPARTVVVAYVVCSGCGGGNNVERPM